MTSVQKSVTVIMPTYNREKTLAIAIDSVLAQTYTDFELLIVDDGSTDGTKQSIEPYLKDSRVKYIYQSNSGRPSFARNAGICEATTEWLAFIDSDDIWLTDKLERQFSLIKEVSEQGTQLDMVVGDYFVIENDYLQEKSFFEAFDVWNLLDIERAQTFLAGYCFEKKQFLQALYSRGFAATQAVLVRNSAVIACGGFDSNLIYSEDNDLWLKVAEFGRVGCVKTPVHYYIIHGENITSIKNSIYYTDTIRVLIDHRTAAKQLEIDLRRLDVRIASYRLGLADCLFSSGRYRLGLLEVIRSIMYLTTKNNIRLFVRCLYVLFHCVFKNNK